MTVIITVTSPRHGDTQVTVTFEPVFTAFGYAAITKTLLILILWFLVVFFQTTLNVACLDFV